MKRIQDAGELHGKRVLVRIDVDDAGVNPFPLKALRPTLDYLKRAGARTILIGHVGRDAHASAEKLFTILKKELELRFVPDITGATAHTAINEMQDGEVVLLENVRQDPRELENSPVFAKELSELADVYVNDAFAVSHRVHASIVGVTAFLPSYAGFRLQEEVRVLSHALTPKSPSLFILSGAKTETKLPLIRKFVAIYDDVFIGGVPANNFFKERGFETGHSVVEDVDISAILTNEKIIVPQDVVVLCEEERFVKKLEAVSPHDKIVDAGPQTIQALNEKIMKAHCVVWNGPLGEYERGFDTGTKDLAKALAKSPAHTLVGGGDTLSAITELNLENDFSFISTGGGAMLQFLLDGTLPGIKALA
ncbi:MAG: phosphoglycerate kinase [Candidatus Paceibacterota bacterium]